MKILRYLIICFFAFIPYVFSQEYPDKPVRLIVPAAPGGGFDFVGRILAQYMGENLKQNFIVENKVGSLSQSTA